MAYSINRRNDTLAAEVEDYVCFEDLTEEETEKETEDKTDIVEQKLVKGPAKATIRF